MSYPEIVRERLGDEEPSTRVSLGGDDELLVTPTRTLIYRAEGLLSGESVEEYPHDAERVTISEGRRKTTIRLDHGIDGESEFTLPSNRVDDALEPVLGGVLTAAEITDPDERIIAVYRLGELTVVVTEARVIKHIGAALWDEEYEEYEYEDVTGLDFEQGNVSSQVIVEVDRRPQRIKAPSEDAREMRERIERALLSYHDVASYEAFQDLVAPDDEDERDEEDADAGGEDERDEEDADDEEAAVETGGTSTIDVEEAAGETTGQPVDVAKEVAALRTAVERQNEVLEDHRRTIEQLIEELRRGR